ncbi:hypothetical protein F4825DRAFT_455831 [Nemania diffusa]|nr:hypothetical protein F4825DRAFT_455831 [Nemania diffusa]
MHHRYLERQAGRRFPITSHMKSEFQRLFGDSPTDARLDGLFRLRWLSSGNSQSARGSLPPGLVVDCRKSQVQHEKGRCKPPDSCHFESFHSTSASAEDKWIDAFPSIARKARAPRELQDYFMSDEALAFRLSRDRLRIGSLEDVWALIAAIAVNGYRSLSTHAPGVSSHLP